MPKTLSTEDALLAISDGLSHAARNPNIKRYKPHKKQYLFHKATKKKKLYIGGNRSGKSVGGVCEDIWRATCTHPYRPDLNAIGPNRGRVVGVSFNDGIEKILFPIFKQYVVPSTLRGGSWDSAYDKTLRTLYFKNGSTIEFMSYDQDLDKFAGTSRHWIHFDEEPPKSIFIECKARLIDTDGDFYITMTPVEGMTWVYDDLYEPYIEQPEEDRDVAIIEIDTTENPYLKESAIKSFVSGIDDEDRTSRISGKFVTVGGRIYKKFDPTVGGLHVLADPLDVQEFVRHKLLICSLDHGLNNPTAILWTAFDDEGFGTVVWEHYKKEWTVDKHAAEIHKINRFLGRQPDLYVADPSIQNRQAVTGTSIHNEYVKYGIAFVLGNNDVKSGLIRVKRYFNPTVLPTQEEPLGKRPRLTIDPRCKWLIWELKKYRYKVYQQKKLQYENNPYEEPQKKDDHACDSLRYCIMTRPDLRSTDEEDFASQVNKIMDDMGMTTAADETAVADPNALKDHPMWTEHNSVPRGYGGDGGWQFDEHLGGVW